ncbi:hypothetical protein BX616_000462 [Lobosporangium transversale]|nr:hypothetical protein BX616_000462 [Lobosporangium transversale]
MATGCVVRHGTLVIHNSVLQLNTTMAHGSRSGIGRIMSTLSQHQARYLNTTVGPATPCGIAKRKATLFTDSFLYKANTCSSSLSTSTGQYQVSALSSKLSFQRTKLFHSLPTRKSPRSNQTVKVQKIRGMASSTSLQRFSENFSISPSNPLVYSITALNVGVFALWQYAEGKAKQFGETSLYFFLLRNFTASARNLREGRFWTLLTNAFSHKEWYHILLNTMVLFSFGDPVLRMLGTRMFLTVYLGSAISGSLGSLAYSGYLAPYLRKAQNKALAGQYQFSMGASGALMGITTAYACVHPFSQYSLFFVINMPAAVLIGLFGAYELYNVLTVNTGRFDSAGHLGGGLFGAAYYLVKLRPLIRRMGRR